MDETFNEASQVLQNEKLSASTTRFVNTKPDELNTGIYLTNHIIIYFILSKSIQKYTFHKLFIRFLSIRTISQQESGDGSTRQQTELDRRQRRHQERSGDLVARDRRRRMDENGQSHVPSWRSRGNVCDQPRRNRIWYNPILAN